VISKSASAKYASGRQGNWLKLKCIQEQELVIGGFTPPSKGGKGIGALLLGYYDAGKLRYAGRSGTGFTQQTHRMLRTKLDKLLTRKPPFAEVPRDAQRDAQWVKPELVAQIAFSTWTRDNLVRQASFKGLREDKPAKEVEREVAIPPLRARQGSSPDGKDSKSRSKISRGEKINRGERSPVPALAITHPDKVLDAESGMTKQQLAEYYLAVKDHLLPHIAGRPLSIVRCPSGSSKPCFFQKHVGSGLPDGISGVPIKSRKSGETDQYLTLDSAEGLVGLAQMGVLEIHTWGSQNRAIEKPDRIVFDLDPDESIPWSTLAETAASLRKRLREIALESFLKSTGGKGLHVVIPITPDHEWPEIKAFAHRIALQMESERPDLYVTKMTKAVRKNRIYLDYLRNDREATSIAPFSPRARVGAPVAMPLHWKELRAETRPVFQVTGFAQWRARLRRDPWAEISDIRQSLSKNALEIANSVARKHRR
jgi:bifunctional non-homologous end joining protein LigD